MRENGGSLDFNFISLPKPAVDKNWVCRHRLLISGKWCRVRCSELFKLFMNGMAYLLNVSTFSCTDRISFYYFRLLTLWIVSSINFALCTNSVQGVCCRLRIFRITDAKYVMFRVGWRKSLKDSATPDACIILSIIKEGGTANNTWLCRPVFSCRVQIPNYS